MLKLFKLVQQSLKVCTTKLSFLVTYIRRIWAATEGNMEKG